MEQSTRIAQKAGSWYTIEKKILQQELDQWLKIAQKNNNNDIQQVKAIIGPHAGLKYCGQTGAWGYQYLQPKQQLRVILLGPSHHYRMNNCGLTSFKHFQTPLGDIEIDTQTQNDIIQKQNLICKEKNITNLFQVLSKQVDEAEHSLELHLPWIQHMLQSQPFTLVPIMVGQVSQQTQSLVADILAEYFDDQNTIFLISSDFCHWGSRFNYTRYDQNKGEIWQSIENLDRQAMQIIEKQDGQGFENYLQQTSNTICGRRPLGIYLNILQKSQLQKQGIQTKFLHYSQSSQCQDEQDSSVSYASAISYIPKK